MCDMGGIGALGTPGEGLCTAAHLNDLEMVTDDPPIHWKNLPMFSHLVHG